MLEQLFERPHVLARHRAGPLLKERCGFLAQLADRGLSYTSLRRIAASLLTVTDALRLADRPDEVITREEVERKATDDRRRFISLATRWLQFLGRLEQRPVPPTHPCAAKVKAFIPYMQHEQGWSPETVRRRGGAVQQFLDRLGATDNTFHDITITQIDKTLMEMVLQDSYARRTVQTLAGDLRAFFRYAESRGWCRKGLAAAIQSPRTFTDASLPLGPSWDDVRRLLAMTEGDRPVDIRDRAILMLLAIYGLRAGEVNRLRLDDFDWERERLSVTCSKTRRQRTYPLTRPVGDAVLRYLKEVRPRSAHREVFLTLLAPIRPLRRALWHIVGSRLRALGVSLPHCGPHALRHACASHLLAQGLSLKEIGDHLGHQQPDTTRIYAKVDLTGLRQVADFDLGGLL
jgi:site-specific recombinase XerD